MSGHRTIPVEEALRFAMLSARAAHARELSARLAREAADVAAEGERARLAAVACIEAQGLDAGQVGNVVVLEGDALPVGTVLDLAGQPLPAGELHGAAILRTLARGGPAAVPDAAADEAA